MRWTRLKAIFTVGLSAIALPIIAQSGPNLRIIETNLNEGLALQYTIENPSPLPVFIYSHYLRSPFVGVFDRKSSSETIWLTFPPALNGNTEQSIETIEIPAGGSYSGRFSDQALGNQILACGRGSTLNLKLLIGWSTKPLRDQTSRSLGFVDAIAEVRSWQSFAASDPVVVRLPSRPHRTKCTASPIEEVWR
jgi:hypothetical protein